MYYNKQTIITFAVLGSILLLGIVYAFMAHRAADEAAYQNSAMVNTLTVPTAGESFTDLQGNPVQLIEDQPKVTVLYSWASWCASCKEELVALNDYAQIKDSVTVSVIAANRKENPQTANRFLETLPDLSHLDIILDPSDYIFESSGGYAVPEVLVYAPNGDLLLQSRGELDITAIDAAIQQAPDT